MNSPGQVTRLDQAMEGLCRFYEWRGRYQEGEVACRTAASKLAPGELAGEEPAVNEKQSPGARPVLPALSAVEGSAVEGLRVWARALAWQSLFSWRLGRAELASQLLRQSLALLEEPESAGQEPVLPPRVLVAVSSPKDTRPEKAFILLHMGFMVEDSNCEEARQLYEQSLALYRALGDRWGMANALSPLSYTALALPAYDEAQRLYEESLALRRALGDQRGIANSLLGLGLTALLQGQLEEGERLARESLAIRREIGDQAGIGMGLLNLGQILLLLGKCAEGHSLLEQSMAIYDDMGDRAGLLRPNIWLGNAKVHLGQYEQAHALGQTALALAREVSAPFAIGLSLFVLGSVALAMEEYAKAQQLLQESVALCQEVGQKNTMDWIRAVLGYAARGLGQLPQAERCLYEALRTAAKVRAFLPLVFALPAIPLLLADRGENERAVELYGLASRYPFVAHSRWFEDVAGRHIAAVAASLPPEVIAAAEERGRARDLEATVAELLVELGE